MGLGKKTQTAADGLQMAHEVVKVAVDCGMRRPEATAPQTFETANKNLLSGGAKQALKTTSQAGQMCTFALYPYKIMVQKLADAANNIREAIMPALDVLDLVDAFVDFLS